jgi:L-fuconolactonase
MWGSDWPVCGIRAQYADWRAAAETLCADLTSTEHEQLFGGTAQRFYRL